MTKLIAAALSLVAVVGCGPSWHRGDNVKLTNAVQRAAVYGDDLSLQGIITPVVSVTDYGFRVNDVRDDMGNQLGFRSFQLFWMKELRFEAAFNAPTAAANSVTIDVEFLSRSGKQRVQTILPISRDVEPDYTTQLRRWRNE